MKDESKNHIPPVVDLAELDKRRKLLTPQQTTKTRPVELLRDRRGIYGIGVSDLFDDEATPSALILRPDRFMDTKPHVNETMLFARDYAVLQKIVVSSCRGPFRHSREEQLREIIHHEAYSDTANA